MTQSNNPIHALTQRFESALLYAHRVHVSQVRKGSGVPYISHLLAVASLVIEAGGDEDEAIAALLHDAVEDQGGKCRLDDIRDKFGKHVAEIVSECSETHEQPKPPWRERKEQYIEHIKTASPSVVLISCADKLHNVRSTVADHRQFGDALWDRFNANQEDTVWFYRSLSDVFKMRDTTSLALEFELVVKELQNVCR